MRRDIIKFAHELEEQDSAAFDLWVWLPSYKEAEEHHGDYAGEYTPSVSDIMKEASMFIADKLSPTNEDREKRGEWYKCPCGEHHYF